MDQVVLSDILPNIKDYCLKRGCQIITLVADVHPPTYTVLNIRIYWDEAVGGALVPIAQLELTNGTASEYPRTLEDAIACFTAIVESKAR